MVLERDAVCRLDFETVLPEGQRRFVRTGRAAFGAVVFGLGFRLGDRRAGGSVEGRLGSQIVIAHVAGASIIHERLRCSDLYRIRESI